MKLELDFLYRLLYALDDLQVFALSMDLERLSLEDKEHKSEGGTPSTVAPPIPVRSRYHYTTGSFSNFPHPQHSFIETLRAPFVELPPEFMDSLQSYGMGLGFRFTPGQPNFLLQELRLPKNYYKLQLMSSSLGLSYYTAPLRPCAMPIKGIKELAGRDPGKVLVEVVTNYSGKYGRILVLIYLGIGCTAWFSFVPIEAGLDSPFAPFESYDSGFFQDPRFKKATFCGSSECNRERGSDARAGTPFYRAGDPRERAYNASSRLGYNDSFFPSSRYCSRLYAGFGLQLLSLTACPFSSPLFTSEWS